MKMKTPRGEMGSRLADVQRGFAKSATGKRAVALNAHSLRISTASPASGPPIHRRGFGSLRDQY